MFPNDFSDHELVRKLGLSLEGATRGRNWFTGWKEISAQDDADLFGGAGGYVGQIIHYFEGKTSDGHDHGVYVNLPGMEGGHILNGAVFDIGLARLHRDSQITQEAMHDMLFAGLEKLNALIEEWRDKE